MKQWMNGQCDCKNEEQVEMLSMFEMKQFPTYRNYYKAAYTPKEDSSLPWYANGLIKDWKPVGKIGEGAAKGAIGGLIIIGTGVAIVKGLAVAGGNFFNFIKLNKYYHWYE